jgi:quercetin dioxygenase-like cupin family protein
MPSPTMICDDRGSLENGSSCKLPGTGAADRDVAGGHARDGVQTPWTSGRDTRCSCPRCCEGDSFYVGVFMAGLIRRSFDSPDETRPFEQGMGQVELVSTDRGGAGRGTFEPGWQWSKHVKPIAGTDSCRAAHTGYCVSGRMKVVMNDGTETEFGPGDFAVIPPGHDAWIVGDEPCVFIDWQGFGDYAKR